jgi:NDP-sugar pyrophosphorylase family protein
MRPFTYEMPKTMIPLKYKPILEHTIERLRDAGIRDILIHIGHLGDKIRNYFGDGKKFGVSIAYQAEKKEQGTAAPLRDAKRFLKNKPFLLHYGDVLAEVDFGGLMEFHLESHQVGTMALTSRVDNPADFGVARLQGTKIVKFNEKPGRGSVSNLVNSGIYVFDPKIFNYLTKSGYSMLEKDVIPKLVNEEQLGGYVFSGRWFDISSHKAYEKALRSW